MRAGAARSIPHHAAGHVDRPARLPSVPAAALSSGDFPARRRRRRRSISPSFSDGATRSSCVHGDVTAADPDARVGDARRRPSDRRRLPGARGREPGQLLRHARAPSTPSPCTRSMTRGGSASGSSSCSRTPSATASTVEPGRVDVRGRRRRRDRHRGCRARSPT